MPRIDAIPYVVLDANGDPVSGGTVNFFEAGTTTPATVYSDAALSASLGSSVSTNAAGQLVSGGAQVDVYAPAGSYKAVVRDAAAVEIATYDNIVVRNSPLTLSEGGTGVQSLTALRDLLDLAEQSPSGPFRNKIINGQFNINQRGAASYTATGYTLDRWRLVNGSGAANTITQETFALGQTDVPGNPKHFLRWARGTAGSAASELAQRIEGVETLSGQTATVTLFAKASAATELTIRIRQNFGTGGSPSAEVVTTVVAATPIATTWGPPKPFTVAIPSIAGKTLGTNGNDYLEIVLFRDHDDTNPTASVDIANVSLVEGDATQEEDPGAWRSIGQELALCQRFYETGRSYIRVATDALETNLTVSNSYAVRKRGSSSTVGVTATVGTDVTGVDQDGQSIRVSGTPGAATVVDVNWTSDAEL
jgi:hypothetical protein